MKYGDTLQQRSIPEWETYNVDYNDLKRLIKDRTTRGQGEALTIPGQSNEARALQAFEDELFAHLVDQHQRVNLFVQSKAGEINRRLIHLDKQIGQLQLRYGLDQAGKVSVKCLKRYAKAEEAAEKAGEEIRSLARFDGAQKLAFIKLLKKYKKWTSSSALETRFRKKVLDRPSSFSKRDFEPLLIHYNDILAAIHAPFEQGRVASAYEESTSHQAGCTSGKAHATPQQCHTFSVGSSSKTPNTIATEIQTVCQDGSNVDFDTALAILPLSRSGGKASYWIHPDNLIELHVLLLQYTRFRKGNGISGLVSTVDPSRRSSRRQSANDTDKSLVIVGDAETGLVVCDDLQRFARRRSSAPIGDTEKPAGGSVEEAAATIRYSSRGEAVIALSASFGDVTGPRASEKVQKLKIKTKAVRRLFPHGRSDPPTDKLLGQEGHLNGENLRRIQQRLRNHPEVQPLVQLRYKRTRFVGLENREAGGVWATLDRDILMNKTPGRFFDMKEGDLDFVDSETIHSKKFPFAVLQVRYEGGFAKDLLSALDETHLTERIRGFSLETHAVATLCEPQCMPPPYWLPALEQDLRKLPATTRTATSRKPPSQLSPGSSILGRASTSATSTVDGPTSSGFSGPAVQSSATSVPESAGPAPKLARKKKRRPLRKNGSLRQQIATDRQPRYWNEYDDGDENSDNEPFAIYIDPNKSTFPSISRAISSLASHAKTSSKKIGLWLRSSDKPANCAPAAGFDGNSSFNQTATSDDDSDIDDSPTDPLLYHTRQRQYSTFNNRVRVNRAFRARESFLGRCCLAFFIASFALLIVAALLASSGRRRAIFRVHVGVITGAVSSLVFAIAGVMCMFKRRGSVGIIQRIIVFAALAVNCIGSGILLAGVADG
ncbi:MAG: hypothetical protein Q9185_001442 [Variospora sp. 1 TL-2023]